MFAVVTTRAGHLISDFWCNLAVKNAIEWLKRPDVCHQLEVIRANFTTAQRWALDETWDYPSPNLLDGTLSRCRNYEEIVSATQQILSRAYAEENDVEAYRLTRQAVRNNRGSIKAWFALMRLAKQLRYEREATKARQFLLGRQPRFQTDLVSDQWALEGFDINDWEIEFHKELEVTLYWRFTGDLAPDMPFSNRGDWTFLRVGNRVYQIGKMENWVENGGFERTPFGSLNQPAGLTVLRYDESLNEFQLAEVERRGNLSHALMLTKGSNKSALRTSRHSVRAGTILLAAAQLYQPQKSQGRLGIALYRNQAPIIYPGKHTKGPKDQWEYVAMSYIVAQGGESAYLYLENRGQGSPLYFDNVIFGEVAPLRQYLAK
jgi:hypothetical protein